MPKKGVNINFMKRLGEAKPRAREEKRKELVYYKELEFWEKEMRRAEGHFNKEPKQRIRGYLGFLNKAREVFENVKKPSLALLCIQKQALACAKSSNFSEAVEYLDKAANYAKTHKTKYEKKGRTQPILQLFADACQRLSSSIKRFVNMPETILLRVSSNEAMLTADAFLKENERVIASSFYSLSAALLGEAKNRMEEEISSKAGEERTQLRKELYAVGDQKAEMERKAARALVIK